MKFHGIKEKVWATFFAAKFDADTILRTKETHKGLVADQKSTDVLLQALQRSAVENCEMVYKIRHYEENKPPRPVDLTNERIQELERKCIVYSNSEIDFKTQIRDYKLH